MWARWRFLIQRIIPPARRPVTVWTIAPLVLSLLIVGLVAWSLEASRLLLFTRPWGFSALLASVWIWWLHLGGMPGLPWLRSWMALWVRLAMVGLLAFLLAEPRAVRENDRQSLMYVLDISDSIGRSAKDGVLNYIAATVTKKPTRDEAGLVAFGRNAAVELPPRTTFLAEALNTQIRGDATNIEQALSLTSAMLPDDQQGRIVLFSDGSQTEGSLDRILDELKARKIAVDVVPIEYDYKNEVWVERIDLPSNVKLGETYEAAVIVSALSDGEGKVVIRENGNVLAEQQVKYREGKTRLAIPLALRKPGYYEYTATIEPIEGADSLEQNNMAMGAIVVEGEGKVLLVNDSAGNPLDWEPLVDSLQKAKKQVDVVAGVDFPRDPSSLIPYDSILFVNVPADEFDNVQLQALRDSVFDLGTGFLMVGGQNSFGPGGYHRTAVEEILPVTMDITQKKVLPKGALAIILHTCEFPEGNTWGKRITKQAIKVLGNQDEVGVLAYDYQDGEKWIFELTPAAKFEELALLINSAEIGDMPSFQQTMLLGVEGLIKSDAASKHMIIISDGDPSPASPDLLKRFIDNKITISTVAVFPHGDVDTPTMTSIAEITGGRYYKPNDPNQLPAIFIKESKTLRRSMIQNREFLPEVMTTSPVLKGLDALPELRGYVLTTAKPDAQVVLKVPPGSKEEEAQLDPLLAIRQHGLGKTAAFTSDLGRNWGRSWVGWGKYEDFVSQLTTDIARIRKETQLRLNTYVEGGQGVVIVEDFAPEDGFLELTGRVGGPNDRSEALTFRQVGPRRYQALVPLWGQGRYYVAVAGAGNKTGADGQNVERKESTFGGFVLAYSPEYLRFGSNRGLLEEIASRTGGRVLTGNPETDELFPKEREPRQSSRPIFDWFLITLACLIPLDVGLRRVQWDWSVITGWFKPRRVATSTMSTLLDKKNAGGKLGPVETTPPKRTNTLPPPPKRDPRPITPPAPPAARPSVAPEKPPAPNAGTGAGKSTYEKLLEMKKQQKKGDPPTT
ncbi:MAG: hypothetical protein C0478_10650 [Planctomyces sp.]|nr:hypothetical protein [Planctomyces sp.]